MIHQLASNMSIYLGKELGLENRRVAIVAYGLEVLIGGLIKLFLFTTIPFLLGILKLFIVAFLSAALLRLPSGGVHNDEYYKCVICTLSIFLSIAFIGRAISAYESIPLNIVVPVILLFVFVVMLKLAPVPVKEKPIKSPSRRLKLKMVSCLVVVIYGGFFFLLELDRDVVVTAALSILFHTFTLTDAGSKSFKKIDALLDVKG